MPQQFMRQFIIALALLGLILGSLLAMAIWQTRKLKREAYQSEQEVIATLKEKIKKIPDDVTALDEHSEAAKSEVNREEKMWSAFSRRLTSSFLRIFIRTHQ